MCRARCIAFSIAILCFGLLSSCAGTSRKNLPILQPVTERVSLQTPLWPTLESWKASGRLRIELPDATIAHGVHLVANKGTSLRIVVMNDGDVVIEDTVLTVKDLTTHKHKAF